MFKAGTALFLYAETSVHLGSGQSLGAIDLAIQRERYTDLPVGASTGLKGVLRDHFENLPNADETFVRAAFGPDTDRAGEHAGAVAFTDLRLLLFPVRSLTGIFAWATSRFVLERFRRDLRSAGAAPDFGAFNVGEGQALVAPDSKLVDQQQVVLEEYALTARQDEAVGRLARWLARHALPDGETFQYWRDRLPQHLVVLADDDFRDFARHATEVVARIKLNAKKTTTNDGGNLFYQENLPAESLLYALVLAQDDLSGVLPTGAATDLLAGIRRADGARLQIGGDASTGRGLTVARFLQTQA